VAAPSSAPNAIVVAPMPPLIGTSWKMNLTSTEADRWFRALLPLVRDLGERELFVLPPFTALWVAREVLRDTPVAWGAQDVAPQDAGAHTGDVSAPMLADLGCRYVEVGHSERRRDHGETPELIGAKAAAALRWGMQPIICIGEHERGDLAGTMRFLLDDLDRCLAAIAPADLARVVIAYEPEWAIGEGAIAAPPDEVGMVHRALAAWLAQRPGGGGVPVIYGGSVDVAGAATLLDEPGVGGLFVGRYALDPLNFARIAGAGAAGVRQEATT
jgi:triosephosphate isomerase